MGQDKVSVSVDQLTVGVTCSQPIVSDTGLLLLGANTRITQQVITGLRERGIGSISVDPRDLAMFRGEPAPSWLPRRDRIKESRWDAKRPVRDQLIDRHDEHLSSQRAAQLASHVSVAKRTMNRFRDQMMEKSVRSVSSFIELSELYVLSMVDDLDHTVGSMSMELAIDGPVERSLKLAVLGMSVACEMGLSGVQTIEVGMAGLLHDASLDVMDSVYRSPIELLNEAQRWEYQKHPLMSAKFVQSMMEISPNVTMAIEQVHEQFDGSGFPRGVRAQRIHLYARILNVVDAYLQLTMANSHRGSIIAHDALGLLLHRAGRGLFDPQVIRAFLNVESLFPLGSHVELDNGQLAKVIRRPKNGYAAPVVETVEGDRIDLELAKTKIIGPTAAGQDQAIRISQLVMQACDWNPACDSMLNLY